MKETVTKEMLEQFRQEFEAQRAHGIGHILRSAPAGDGKHSVPDHLIIFVLHGARHIGGDDARAHFVYQNALLCQAVGVQGRQHGDACL